MIEIERESHEINSYDAESKRVSDFVPVRKGEQCSLNVSHTSDFVQCDMPNRQTYIEEKKNRTKNI